MMPNPPTEEELLNALTTPSTATPQISTPTPKNKTGFSMWEFIDEVVGSNTCEIFGDTGSGKTKTCMQIAYECAKEGKKVKYIDHEANLSKKDIKTLETAGVKYKLLPDYKELYKTKKEDLAGYDLIIIDSVTLAITGKWSGFDMHQKGEILQQLQGMMYRIAQECISSKAHTVIVTAQPISVMGDRHVLMPVGDKSLYMAKEIYYIRAPRDESGSITSRTLVSFRSRSFADGTIITNIDTKQFGADLDHKIMADLLKNL